MEHNRKISRISSNFDLPNCQEEEEEKYSDIENEKAIGPISCFKFAEAPTSIENVESQNIKDKTKFLFSEEKLIRNIRYPTIDKSSKTLLYGERSSSQTYKK